MKRKTVAGGASYKRSVNVLAGAKENRAGRGREVKGERGLRGVWPMREATSPY